MPPTQTTQRVPNRSSKPIDRARRRGRCGADGRHRRGRRWRQRRRSSRRSRSARGNLCGFGCRCGRRFGLRRRCGRGRRCQRLWRGSGWRRPLWQRPWCARELERAQPLVQATNGAELRERNHECGNGNQPESPMRQAAACRRSRPSQPPLRRSRPMSLEHDPEKWIPVFRKRSCSTKNPERDGGRSHRAPWDERYG